MAISWESYLSRRRIKLDPWLKVNNVRSYDDLVRTCAIKGVVPPSKDIFSTSVEPLLQSKASTPVQTTTSAKKPGGAPKKAAKKKAGSSSSTRKKPDPKKKSGDK